MYDCFEYSFWKLQNYNFSYFEAWTFPPNVTCDTDILHDQNSPHPFSRIDVPNEISNLEVLTVYFGSAGINCVECWGKAIRVLVRLRNYYHGFDGIDCTLA